MLSTAQVQDWRMTQRAAYTWGKHADRDPDAGCDLRLGMLALPIVAAVNDYQSCFGRRTRPMMAYHGWFTWRHHDLIDEEPSAKRTAAASLQLFGDPAAFDFQRSLQVLRLRLYMLEATDIFADAIDRSRLDE